MRPPVKLIDISSCIFHFFSLNLPYEKIIACNMNKYLAYFIILVLGAASAAAQTADDEFASNYLFSYLTVDNGLPNNFVDGIYKDSRGFVWICTSGGGLLRHDGSNLVHFNNRSDYRLKSNYVRCVCEDNFDRLWIASENGIDIMDLATYGKSAVSAEDGAAGIYNTSTYKVIKDSRGCIWATTRNSVTRFEFDARGNVVGVNTLHPGTKVNYAVTALYELDGQMIAGINNRLMTLVADDKGNLVASPFATSLRLDCNVVKCIVAKENELWIGTDNGLFRYNLNNGQVKAYYHDENDNHSLSQNFITDLKLAANGQLIVGTLKGLNFYDSLNDFFYIIFQDDEQENYHRTINSNFVHTIFCDDRIIWIGTESCGVNKMIKPVVSAKNFQSSNTPTSITNGPVNSIYEDSDGTLWVGCMEGGLNSKPRGAKSFRRFTVANGLSHNSVSSITPINSNTLLLGTWGGGITIFDKAAGRAVRRINIENDSINITFVGASALDTINNGVWIGSNRGMYFYDIATGGVSNILPDSITHNISGALGAIVTSNGTLLMGTTEGVVRVDLHSLRQPGGIRCSIDRPKDIETEYLSKITCFMEGGDGDIYIGTNGFGVIKRRGGVSKQILTTDNGLSNDICTFLAEDNSHRLWIATANGLSCYSPQSQRVSCYYREDGLCDNHFFWNGGHRTKGSNMMYLGSLHGLIAIDTERSHAVQSSCAVYFTDLTINDQKIHPDGTYINTDISRETDIRIHERDKSVTLGFSALDYNSPASITYQYRLLGFSEQWTTVAHSRRVAVFSNLTQGDYIFQVRCATDTGEFSAPAEINIHVKGFFYKQWWFILLVVVIVIAISRRIVHRRMEALRTQKQLLEEKVVQRTAALESKTEELSRQNELLFRQNEEISRQKTQLEQMTSKIQELTLDKLAFFTNITHEFRTPLTLIIGPIERALKLSTNPKVIEQLNFVDHNSKHLLSLVNQLMDFRKVETDNMPVNLAPGNFRTFIDDILLPFHSLSQDKGIEIRLYFHLENPYIMFDREAMVKILTNLIGNAVKFTPKDGRIDVYVARLHSPDKLYIAVSDTGSGIVEKDVEKIFNSFYQSKNENAPTGSGTGIGLYLCKKLANLLGGDITARNNKRRGACFRMLLPLVAMEELPAAPVANYIGDVDDNGDGDDDTITNSRDRMTVLVVEDNQEMRQYIRTVLSDQYMIFEAVDGNNALSVLRSNLVDLILSDLMMPGMNGLELAKRVRSDSDISHIPVIILTAKTSRDSMLESFRNGVDDYITKPFDEATLKAKIQSLIENRRKFQQRFNNDMDSQSLNIPEDSYDKKFIDKVLKIIKDNYRDAEFDVNELITQMGVSKTFMNKKMQALTQQSAGPFIRAYRLKVARDLIIKNRITHNMNISEIAYDVGFNDPKYFTRCFTKQYGVTPSSMLET